MPFMKLPKAISADELLSTPLRNDRLAKGQHTDATDDMLLKLI